MITEGDINAAFNTLETAFKDLAEIEDKQSALNADLAEYKEGSAKAESVRAKIQALQPALANAQRAFRLAAMKADRVRLLLDCQKTAMGRD